MHHFRLELTPFPCVIFDHYISGIGIKDLQLILDTTPSGKHAVIIMDQASWHQTYLEDQFDNLLIMHLPPCSPELNPVVNVWSWLCQNEIANRYFKTYNDTTI
ncbi:hypothetical protein CW745_14625 [Psychromonas sp. psych-6C06]|nr:hypothetical protein CW745_14625 [Psychromonas sp. psych-6C06]